MERTILRRISTTALVSDVPHERERTSCFIDPARFERFEVGVGSPHALPLSLRGEDVTGCIMISIRL
jgi:hypothetical protein